jgi:hypothetical protein
MNTKDSIILAKQTCEFAKRIADYSFADKLKQIKNTGKRKQMCVSATIILDALSAFSEYCTLLDQKLENTKVSRSLLTRYIYESHVNFLYIFSVPKNKMQARTKAFYHFGGYKKSKIRNDNNLLSEEAEWRKYVQKGRGVQWHGKTFQEISEEVRYSTTVYQALSLFSHPGIFTLERVMATEMFTGIIEDSIIFTSASICDLMEEARKNRLLGLKLNPENERKIKELAEIHKNIIKMVQAALINSKK